MGIDLDFLFCLFFWHLRRFGDGCTLFFLGFLARVQVWWALSFKTLVFAMFWGPHHNINIKNALFTWVSKIFRAPKCQKHWYLQCFVSHQPPLFKKKLYVTNGDLKQLTHQDTIHPPPIQILAPTTLSASFSFIARNSLWFQALLTLGSTTSTFSGSPT